MNDIHAIGGSATTGTPQAFRTQAASAPAAERAAAPADRVEISDLAALLGRLAELPEARARKIVEIRNAIDNGTYESEEKLAVATERLLDAIEPR
ncbi:MAG: flagellar biosynthesis anti-sigma factor FlgM [Phycisphaerae bacterium]